jgi:hypothetical protein
MAARCFAAVAPPPVVVGGVGADDDPFDGWVGVSVKQAGTEGVAELVDGITSLGETGEGAINPCRLPPMLSCGWEGASDDDFIVKRAGNGEPAKLGDGLAALW